MHILETGVFVGQFGQAKGWNIQDMTPYKKRKPRYVHEWYTKLRERFKALKQRRNEGREEDGKDTLATDPGIKHSPTKPDGGSPLGKDTAVTEGGDGKRSDGSMDSRRSGQSEYEDKLAEEIDYTDEDEIEQDGSRTITNAARFLAYKPTLKTGRGMDENRYFDRILNG